MTTVTKEDIVKGFKDLGIYGERAVIHSSLSSFGYVVGGADTVLDALKDSFKTLLFPAFWWGSNSAPPDGDRPQQNGCDYAFYDNWNKPLTPFVVENASVEKSLGIISKKASLLPNSKRSDHAWQSWVAYGDMATELVDNHPWEIPNLPLERLSKLGGYVVLLGVNLSSCTAIHLAEERAGRRPFIRWMTDRNGNVKRVRAAGCGKGFHSLWPYCQELFKETHIGDCKVLTTQLEPFIQQVTGLIKQYPELTRCSPNCLRCGDAMLGGPSD